MQPHNGPGETDDADLGLWCGPAAVNLKKGTESLGAYDLTPFRIWKLVETRESRTTARSPIDAARPAI